ncbi:hydrogenase maturation protease [Mycolicibacterium lacusdiani]|uniref:hydrogenase maturation protease n=1 Tax=Mycolicibacterium lacusdiani TaxID=2895283 RepID=UPI001F015812|nr:hydrogenase maturation protease [Mycolicibacterium lacusdiani]
MTPRILVAGIGNIFLGDDGFGPEVIRHARSRPYGRDFPGTTVKVVDYGIRGMHLAYDLLDDWTALVLIDAVPDRGAPGSLRVFDADHETIDATLALDAHGMDPAAVFASLRALGGTAPPTFVIGCQVDSVEDGIGLTDVVDAAVPAALDAIDSVLRMVTSDAPAREG